VVKICGRRLSDVEFFGAVASVTAS